jgi:gliding motility-associated protein GldM
MAGEKLSNRQKMINMMYLVLTALLALNVSAEVLKAFADIKQNLDRTNTTVESKNKGLYSAFAKKAADEPEKYKSNYEKAMQVQATSEALIKYIGEVENVMIDEAGKKDGKADATDYQEGKPGRLLREDDIDASTRLLVGEAGKGTPLGLGLVSKVQEARSKYFGYVEPAKQAEFKAKILLQEPVGEGSKTWLQSTFGSMPVAGAMTQLTKLKNDVRNSETEMVSYLLNDVDAESFKFDQLVAQVIAPTNILQGQSAEARILLVAYDSRRDLNISVGGASITTQAGIGTYKLPNQGIGNKKIGGNIFVKDASGVNKPYPFEFEYLVSAPSASVTADKMNVFYIGVDNPVTVAVAGVPNRDVRASMSNGTMNSAGDGKYNVRVSAPGESNVSVSAMVGGKSVSFGTKLFRIKRIPTPNASAGGLQPGSVPAGSFKVQGGVVAILKDFDFDARFNVEGFRFIYLPMKQDPRVDNATGPRFTGNMQNMMNAAKPGDTFVIDNIRARGPDGTPRQLDAITYRLQ